jgi:hypothetical protein
VSQSIRAGLPSRPRRFLLHQLGVINLAGTIVQTHDKVVPPVILQPLMLAAVNVQQHAPQRPPAPVRSALAPFATRPAPCKACCTRIRHVRSVRYPAISAASIQLIFFAIAFNITSCNFIVRSIAAALIDPGFVKLQNRRRFVARTYHL